MEPEIRFCTSADGVRIAYATLGNGWVPLVCCGGWGSAFETNWSHPESRAVLQQLSRDRMLVMYDRRGVGASQREVDELPLDLETEIGDLSSVVDNLRLAQFDLFGERLGAPAAVAYAATYPNRVRKLVLWGLVASGGESKFKEDIQVTVARILRDWGVARRVTAQQGDEAARAVLREHERLTREALGAHGGAEVKAMGDGFMAWFPSATRAVQCAIALQKAFAERSASDPEPIRVRIGVNAGEPIAEGDDLFGASVITTARIAAQASGGQILASDVVRQLLAGKGFAFGDWGEHSLKGFDEPVRLHEVQWQEGGA